MENQEHYIFNILNKFDLLAQQLGAMGLGVTEYVHLVVPSKSAKFDEANDDLKAAFAGHDLEKFNAITLSGNSYGTEACKWIAENVLKNWTNLKYVNFSNIFVSRLKEEIPVSLRFMMD